MTIGENTKELLLKHYNEFPLIQTEDIFKYLHQSVFGCEHLISSPQAAADYIEKEAANAKSLKNQTDILDGDFHEVISCLKDGINSADKVKKQELGEWDYRVNFYYTGINGKTLGDIYMYKTDDDGLYFVWKDRCYKINEADAKEIFEEIEDRVTPDPEITEEEND